MFEATLKNRISARSAPVTISFPIPEDQYEQAILALEKSQIGDARVQDCLIDNVHAPNCPALVRMTGTMANVDELDWLGKQLESFDRYELLQFNAAVDRFGLSAADELIDLSFCARDVTVVSDFNDLELVGKRHYLTVHGACDPKELEDLDGKETALALISGQPGYVTRYGVVYDNGMKLEQAYDRKHLPPIWMPESCIMELKIRATGEDDPKKQEWVQLPASQIKLERAMRRAGIASCGEMQMLVSDSQFPDEVDCDKFAGMLDANSISGTKDILQLTERLDDYVILPGCGSAQSIGKYLVGCGAFPVPEKLIGYINYDAVGIEFCDAHGGAACSRGFVVRKEGLPKAVLDDLHTSKQTYEMTL